MHRLINQLLILAWQEQRIGAVAAHANLTHVVRDSVALLYPLADSLG